MVSWSGPYLCKKRCFQTVEGLCTERSTVEDSWVLRVQPMMQLLRRLPTSYRRESARTRDGCDGVLWYVVGRFCAGQANNAMFLEAPSDCFVLLWAVVREDSLFLASY